MFRFNPLRNSLRLALGALLITSLALVVARGFAWNSHWDRIQAEGRLVVAIRKSEGVYWPTDEAHSGFEHELLYLLAQRLNLEVTLFSVTNMDDLYRALASGAVDMALPGTTLDPNQADFMAGLPYLMSPVGLVRPMASKTPKLDDHRIALLDATSHGRQADLLMEQHPELRLNRHAGETAAELMTRIELGELEMAMMDERDFLVQRPFFPGQRFDALTSRALPIAPLFRKHWDRTLLDQVNEALRLIRSSGDLARLQDRHLGHTSDFDYVGTLTFERHVKSRLPNYLEEFQRQAEATGLDWRLLAAVAYQESHWRANAVSPTGVKGIMMVTLAAAKDMGISNRLDPVQSITAGSRYLKGLRARIPERITEPDRTWLALAAYNVGAGHLEDARILTQSQGDNPDSWIDLRRHLPKLALKDWYPHTRHGYARGHEPVVYVANIRRYYNLLRKAFPMASEDGQTDAQLDKLPLPGVPVAPGL